MSIDFERPWLLVLLPVCLAVVYLLWRTSRTYMPPMRRKASLLIRVVVVSMLCLTIASPMVQLRAYQLAVALLLDRSDSISPAARDEQEQWVARAMAAKGANDQVAVITFGEDATVERALSEDPHPPRLAPDATGSRTNIAAAIRAGVAALPPSAWCCFRTVAKTSTTPIQPPRWHRLPMSNSCPCPWALQVAQRSSSARSMHPASSAKASASPSPLSSTRRRP